MSHEDAYTRQTFIKKSGAAGVAILGGTLWASRAGARARAWPRQIADPDHLVVSCQENRSFDHYYGYAPQVQARRYGPPRLHTARCGGSRPRAVRADALRSVDPPHGWGRYARPVERRPDGRLLQGTPRCYTGSGDNAIPYYRSELPFYYSPLSRLGSLRELLLLAARADVAEPLLPHVRHVGRHHDEPGLRHLRLGVVADHPRPLTTAA